ncbi:hypothetical protein LEL_02124 [Akanthomyces lecanii RCEF 1005]|uniref:Uncharacterized protein n=1 Tax=Akanthomyces lecanii RCEF 1005 TaxID=1081108 RepID=A0A168L1H5_CORDF|nr:hypothetical protein LEL_02124 [Akanthomyces lecanii RCEF 1005]
MTTTPPTTASDDRAATPTRMTLLILEMEDVEMTEQILPADNKSQAYQHLDAAKAAFNKAAPTSVPDHQKSNFIAEAEAQARTALRLANNDKTIQAYANIQSAKCHELQDKHNTAWYEYRAAKDQAGARWSESLEHRLMFCYRKTHPKK